MSWADMAALDPEGDFVKQHLLNPHVLRLLGDVRGRRILDAGAGQGYFSRMLAARGARVVALEPASRLRSYAEQREGESPQGIEFMADDLTKVALGPTFDAVVANMVLLSIPDWEVALRSCVGALVPGGQLIFTIEHPCLDDGGSYFVERLQPRRWVPDYHRPLSAYVNAFIESGCVLDGLAEPALDAALIGTDPAATTELARRPHYLVVHGRRLA